MTIHLAPMTAAAALVALALFSCGDDATTGSNPASPEIDRAAIEAAMGAFLDEAEVPGVLVGVRIGEGDPVLLARGIDDLETGSTLEADRLFRIGSVSKALLASVLFEAAATGDLSLDDTLGQYVDGATNPSATLAQILSHDAGLADWDALDGGTIRTLLLANFTRNWDPDDIVEEVKALPAVSEPGQGFSYSNPGFQMLGAIVEQATGEPIAVLVDQLLARRYGLSEIRFGPLGDAPEKLIHGWGDLGGNLVDSQDLPSAGIDSLFYTTGAGYSDLDDLLAFARLFWGAEGALSPAGVDVTEDRSGNYGLATQILGDDFFGHTGDVFGSRTVAGHSRTRDASIVVHANSNVVGRAETVTLARAALDAISSP